MNGVQEKVKREKEKDRDQLKCETTKGEIEEKNNNKRVGDSTVPSRRFVPKPCR